MAKTVPFNGRPYEFPDDATDAEINEFLAKEEKSPAGFGRNVLSSGGQFAGDIYHAVTNPKETAKGLLDLSTGVIEKMSGVQGPQAQYADAVGQFLYDRYGDLDKARETAYRDPVGFLSDASMVLGGGAAVLKGAGAVSRIPALGTAARVVNAAAEAADPLRIAGMAATAPMRAPGLRVKERLYESALKPPTTLPRQEVRGMIRTGLEAGIPVSESGLKKLWGQIIDLNDKVTQAVGQATGVTVNRGDVARRLEDTRRTFSAQVNPERDLKRIAKSEAEFLRQDATKAPYTKVMPGIEEPGYFPVGEGYTLISEDMPATKAQRIKVGTYRQLKDKAFGELKSAAMESQKALARGIKEELAAAIPELASLNAAESKRLGLTDVLERAVTRQSNHQLFGIGTPIAMGGVGAATGSTEMAMAAGVLRAILDSPHVKSRLAIMINRAQQLNPGRFGPARMATATGRVDEYLDRLRAAAAEAQPQPATAGP